MSFGPVRSRPTRVCAGAASTTLESHRSWARPWTRPPTTTRGRRCGTTTPGTSDAGSPSPCAVRSPPASLCPSHLREPPGTRTALGRPGGRRPIGADNANDDLAEEAVASCVAKYATKAAETTGTVDRRIGELARQAHRPVRPGSPPDRSLLRLRRRVTGPQDLSVGPHARLPKPLLTNQIASIGRRGGSATQDGAYDVLQARQHGRTGVSHRGAPAPCSRRHSARLRCGAAPRRDAA